jgi:hypothetical protein
MKLDQSGVRRIRASLYAFLLIACACLPNIAAGADTSQMLVGSWYGERAHSGTFAGKTFNHRRWLIVHQSDGSARDIHRYYLDGTVQGEYIEEYGWGVTNNIYWNICRSKSIDGAVTSCSERSEYEIQSVTSGEFRYRSVQSQISYSVVRVPKEFRLP